MENVPPTEITVAGKALDANGNAYFVWEDNTTHDVTPRANARYYTFTVGASKQCAPVKIDFEDSPSRGPSCNWEATLQVVCHKDWSWNYTPITSITYGFSADSNGLVTIHHVSGAGNPGDCRSIIVSTLTNIPGGIHIKAYYIGCCDDDLNWVQTITINTTCPKDKKTVPYNDPYPPSAPYYFGPSGSSNNPWDIIDNHTSDYMNSNYPSYCP